MKQSWNKTFMNIAVEISKHSTCLRKQVGAILVKDRRIISTGYNGSPSGETHCSEYFKDANITSPDFMKTHGEWSETHEIHAEINCLFYSARNGISTLGTILYITLSPCINCAKSIKAAGIDTVVYLVEYDRDTSGILFLKNNNINVYNINEVDNL